MQSGVVVPTSVSQVSGGYTHQTSFDSSPNIYSYLKLLLLLAIVGSVIRAYESRESSRLYGGRVKRQQEQNDLSLSETLIEGFMTFATRICMKVSGFVVANTRSVLCINMFSRRIIIADPSMERALDRHVDDTSLADNLVIVGRRMFNLSQGTVDILSDYNSRPNHRRDFSGFENSRVLLDAASKCAQHRLDSQPDVQEAQLGIWLFKLTSAAMTTALWGPRNPWVLCEDFTNRFISFTYGLPTLLRPFPHITAPRAVEARRDVLAYLRSFHFLDRENRVQQLAHRLNIVAMADPSWESNPDYFHVELLTAQGLIVTPSAMVTWLVRHLLASRDVLQRAAAEVRGGIDAADLRDGKLDADHVRKTCPTLVASLHETLRLHMTAIPRVAKKDFDLPTPDSQVLQVRKGDMINLPMSSFNKNPATWGPDFASFNPDRFIAKDGSVSASVVRKLRTFGVASNMCPGRKFGFDAVLFVVATLLRNFDLEPVDGEGRRPGVPCAAGFGGAWHWV
ncbi:Cytochrome P450 monooxygenase nodJ-like protein [Cladobotryum mycophilum]|uniref:Cytochrome P450 monooxygenase nodJ-like protein n=1 Tax=Cladobotryum mycophilum TaxID=491253 RepID=A0ABR0SKA5_9HYPO